MPASPQPTRPIALDRRACYAAFRAHDVRFDGRIFVCVASTGIYCRPVCRVRMPREDNCTFQSSAAAAEAAGFRPCLKCRPELAPGLAPADAAARLARKAARSIEEDGLSDRGLADLAHSLGVSDRHLRRAFAREYGVSPVQYLQTRRLLLAKSLLTDTGLSVLEVAMASGFGSLRRCNDLFRKRYRLAPTALRKLDRTPGPGPADGVTLPLGYRPPYRWDSLVDFLGARSIPGVESVGGGVYRRAVSLAGGGATHRGWIAVEHLPARNSLAVTVASSLLPVLPRVLARVRHLFDLDSDPAEIQARLSGMNDLKPGLCLPGTRVPGCFDSFEMAVRAILGQQITVKAARTLATRLATAFGGAVETPFPGLDRVFPTPEDICRLGEPIEARLGPLGVIGARARSIAALARAMAGGAIDLSPAADSEREMERLLALPGFGPWTVQYLALRALGWPDAFPHTDYGGEKGHGRRDAGGNPGAGRGLAALALLCDRQSVEFSVKKGAHPCSCMNTSPPSAG